MAENYKKSRQAAMPEVIPSLPPQHDSGTITAEFEASVRPYIDLIDKLRSYDIEKDVPLPAIVVVGDQSSGKSSVLEALSGVQLPRGSGMMTRCPLTLRLKSHKSKSDWTGKISYKVGKNNITEEIEYPDDVDDAVKTAQDKIAGPKDNKRVLDEMIDLQITGHGVPDLTLIDLPGIIRTTTKPDDDTSQKIKAMIQNYISKETTVIMAVIPANQDLETTEGLQMAKQVDPDGKRTIGVVTKPDRVEKGLEAETISLICNEKYPLRKGFVVVKCRSQDQLKKGLRLADAIKKEEEFFANHQDFGALSKHYKGTQSLAKKLVNELVHQIKRYNPVLQDKVKKRFEEVKGKLNKLGTKIPDSPTERGQYLYRIIATFMEDIKRMTDGNGENGRHIFAESRRHYQMFSATTQSLTPNSGNKKFLESLRQTIEAYRGPELQGFESYAVFSSHIRDIVANFKEPALTCMENTFSVIKTIIDKWARETFERYPGLLQEVNGHLYSIYEKVHEDCAAELERLFQMEAYIYTNDATYLASLRDMQSPVTVAPAVPVTQPSRATSLFGQVASHQGTEVFEFSQLSASTTVKAREEVTFQKIKAYLNVCTRRINDTVPMTIAYYVIHQLGARIQDKLIGLASDPRGRELLDENPEKREDREDLQRRHDNLQKALMELRKF